jgi:hypothetical protein
MCSARRHLLLKPIHEEEQKRIESAKCIRMGERPIGSQIFTTIDRDLRNIRKRGRGGLRRNSLNLEEKKIDALEEIGEKKVSSEKNFEETTKFVTFEKAEKSIDGEREITIMTYVRQTRTNETGDEHERDLRNPEPQQGPTGQRNSPGSGRGPSGHGRGYSDRGSGRGMVPASAGRNGIRNSPVCQLGEWVRRNVKQGMGSIG